jgi:hypothetical protein
MQGGHGGHGEMDTQMVRHHYLMLDVNLLLSLIIMYVATFAVIWSGASSSRTSTSYIWRW